MRLVRRVITRASAAFRARHLQHLPRSPHQNTAEFAKGWRDAINGVAKSRCPYAALLSIARWEDGFDTALKVRATRNTVRARPALTAIYT